MTARRRSGARSTLDARRSTLARRSRRRRARSFAARARVETASRVAGGRAACRGGSVDPLNAPRKKPLSARGGRATQIRDDATVAVHAVHGEGRVHGDARAARDDARDPERDVDADAVRVRDARVRPTRGDAATAVVSSSSTTSFEGVRDGPAAAARRRRERERGLARAVAHADARRRGLRGGDAAERGARRRGADTDARRSSAEARRAAESRRGRGRRSARRGGSLTVDRRGRENERRRGVVADETPAVR